jgi:hypothetical protein
VPRRPPAGTFASHLRSRISLRAARARLMEAEMNSIIYLVGLLVIVMAILSLLGLR